MNLEDDWTNMPTSQQAEMFSESGYPNPLFDKSSDRSMDNRMRHLADQHTRERR